METNIYDIIENQKKLINRIKNDMYKLEKMQNELSDKLNKILDSDSETNNEEDDEYNFDLDNMNISKNLYNCIGKSDEKVIVYNSWTPLRFSGLNNSKPIFDKNT